MSRRPHHEKTVNLALQGGGSHGAFTWGVLDRLLEDQRLRVTGVSGTSAGAMNAVVMAQGFHDGKAEGARAALHDFWKAVSEAGRHSPLKRNPVDIVLGNWTLDHSPTFIFADLMQRLASPYDLNPLDLNPLRDLVERHVDFDKVRECTDMHLYLSATNVETGRVRVFHREEVSLDVVMASACLPHLFKAVEIDGHHYWDGGYMGNPSLFPFLDTGEAGDVVIVQINPVYRSGVPTTAREILNRVNEITFNSSLMKELRTIDYITRMVEQQKLADPTAKPLHVHMIEARKQMRPLGASSKLNTEWAFLTHLFEIGRGAADRWLHRHYDDLGVRPSIDISAMFGEVGPNQSTG